MELHTCELLKTVTIRDGLPKKIAVLLDFVQMRGGTALPKFFVHFSQTVFIGEKNLVQIVQIRGRGESR